MNLESFLQLLPLSRTHDSPGLLLKYQHLVASDCSTQAMNLLKVDGIMIYYPVFGQRPSFHGGSHDDYLRDTVSPYKAEGSVDVVECKGIGRT